MKPDRGLVRLDSNECKGCGLCVEACPPLVLHLSEVLNPYGYHPAGGPLTTFGCPIHDGSIVMSGVRLRPNPCNVLEA